MYINLNWRNYLFNALEGKGLGSVEKILKIDHVSISLKMIAPSLLHDNIFA